jgi:hypothetical protein
MYCKTVCFFSNIINHIVSLDMHALIFSRFTYNQQDDDVAGNVTKKIEKYASPRLIYPLGPSKCTPCMMFLLKEWLSPN